MTKDELLELADRVEREEPSRELDVRVFQAVNGIEDEWDRDFGADDEYGTMRREGGWFCGTINGICDWHVTPPYTTSLDAAVTLVPEGWRAKTDSGDPDLRYSPPSAELVPFMNNDKGWVAAGKTRPYAEAKSAALALCAAALRARASLTEE